MGYNNIDLGEQGVSSGPALMAEIVGIFCFVTWLNKFV